MMALEEVVKGGSVGATDTSLHHEQELDDLSEEQVDEQAQDEEQLDNDEDTKEKKKWRTVVCHSCTARWARLLIRLRRPLLRGLHALTQASAKNPVTTIITVIALSLFLFIVGYFTNFVVVNEEIAMLTPQNSLAMLHQTWVETVWEQTPEYIPGSLVVPANYSVSKIPTWYRRRSMEEEEEEQVEENLPIGWTVLIFHANGDNVLQKQYLDGVWHAIDRLRSIDAYQHKCSGFQAKHCTIEGATRFWDNDSVRYMNQVNSTSDAIRDMSSRQFPDGFPVIEETVLGKTRRDANGSLVFVESYLVKMDYPSIDLEYQMIDEVREIWDALEQDNSWNGLRMEMTSGTSFTDEFTRGMIEDIPFVPAVFITMSVFICLVFYKCDRIQSRCLLGVSAVVSVLLAIMSGYGLLFITGTPVTGLTQILPFIVFGIGVDDAFIITGAYFRTDHAKNIEDRVHDTIEECGVSILLTSVTSSMAFGIGAVSTVPVVRWLCLYAFPAILFDFAYQITFFIACIVLDERRVRLRRSDCCVCFEVHSDKSEVGNNYTESSSEGVDEKDLGPDGPFLRCINRYMAWHAQMLLRPRIKVLVVLAFAALLGSCAYSVSLMGQYFDLAEMLPKDSYVIPFEDAKHSHTDYSIVLAQVYFRDVNQTDPEIQRQMFDYVSGLAALASIDDDQPDFFWLRDFKRFVDASPALAELEFNDQLDVFLAHPIVADIYGGHIKRDSDGNVLYSRCLVRINVDWEDVDGQISLLNDQRAVAGAQLVNKGIAAANAPFFAYESGFNLWEFYAITVDELIFTTVVGTACVTFMVFLFVPHWTAVFFAFPMLLMLYIELLGIIQWAGVHLNAFTYLCLVLSIGLLVDYVVHILFGYYATPGNRQEKTATVLRTTGTSILLGGLSTFLGTLFLAFCQSEIFYTIFIAFVGIVSVGLANGLLLLPVVLSSIGPDGDCSLLGTDSESLELCPSPGTLRETMHESETIAREPGKNSSESETASGSADHHTPA